MKISLLFLVICLGQTPPLLVSAMELEAFLDCPGNQPSFLQSFSRRCCKSPKLPKGCECFSIEKKSGFTDSSWSLPSCPDQLGVNFLLFGGKNKTTYKTITKASELQNSRFQKGNPLKIIIHGFRAWGLKDYNLNMKNAIFKKEPNANVILLDWKKGARVTFLSPYHSAVANVRTVGALLARLLLDMKKESYLADFKGVHLIGHSLGAHVAGTAGKELKRLTGTTVGRITGLDPAGPMYNNYGDRVRLGKDDGDFVDIIHTDDNGFGIRDHVGNVDFWPNGGKTQPQCEEDHGFNFEELIGICDHMSSLDFFTHSINDCVYDMGDGCTMGYYATPQQCQLHYNHTTFSTIKDKPYCLVKKNKGGPAIVP